MKIKILLLLCLIFMFSGCTHSEKSTNSLSDDLADQLVEQAVKSVMEPSQTNEKASKESIEVVSEKYETYVDSIKTPHIIYLGVIKNISDKPLNVYNVSVDVLDSENNLIKHLDNTDVFPSTIMPGEYGYICDDCAKLDKTINLDNVAKTEMFYSCDFVDYQKPNVEITQCKLSPRVGDRGNVLGKVKANEDIDTLWVALPIFDIDGNLKTVGFTIIHDILAGEERGFECSLDYYDYKNEDLIDCGVAAIPYYD